MPRYAMQTAVRAACVDMLEDYATAASIKLQVYPARPRSVNPPTAFVDNLSEATTYTGLLVQRLVTAEVIVMHGLFDSKVAADQRDAFVDGFIDHVIDTIHAAGSNTTIGAISTEDVPDYINDWMPPAEQRTYYATRIVLEGLSLTG